MVRLLVALTLICSLPFPAYAGQPSAPVLALWEFDGWAAPTPERPLGLRFVLMEDGSVIFAPDDPAIDGLIPNQFFQAKLSPPEAWAMTEALAGTLSQQVDTASPGREGGETVFVFRDADGGKLRQVVIAGHPCMAKGRVFSATAPVSGLSAVQNSSDRMALSPAMREVCNRLAGFHHVSAAPWSPAALPLPWKSSPVRQ